MKRIISITICFFILLSCQLRVQAASGVPQEVMDATKSVVRILAEHKKESYTGSGFVIKNDGIEVLIATNDHVVSDNPDRICIWVGEDRQVDAEIVFTIPSKDICVLRLTELVSLAPLTLSDEPAQHGAAIYAVGYPGAGDVLSDTLAHTSDSATITDGIISAIRTFTIEEGAKPVKLLQVNAAINSGNSGGPLFNTKGEVIGINTYKVNVDSQGVFGSVDISELKKLLNEYGIVLEANTPETEPIPTETEPLPTEEVIPVEESSNIPVSAIAIVAVLVILTAVVFYNAKSKKKLTLRAYMSNFPQGLSVGEAVSMLLPTAIALRNLHNNGKLHLQVSPDTILISTKGAVLKDPSKNEMDRHCSGFTAPEVYRGTGYGITSDVYSFAALLLFAATGKNPSNSLQQNVLCEEIAALESREPAFGAVVRKAMAFLPQDRTQSLQELIYEISAFHNHEFHIRQPSKEKVPRQQSAHTPLIYNESAEVVKQREEEKAAVAKQKQEAKAAAKQRQEAKAAVAKLKQEAKAAAKQKQEEKAAVAKQEQEAKAAAAKQRQEEKAAAAKQRQEEKAAAVKQRQEAKAAAAKQRQEAKAAAAKQRQEAKAAAAKQRQEAKAAAAKRKQEAKVAIAKQKQETKAAAAKRKQEAKVAIAKQKQETKAATKPRTAKASKIFILVIGTAAVSVPLLFYIIIPSVQYNKAVSLVSAGRYEEAIAAFEAIGDYKDSAQQIDACRESISEETYLEAIALKEQEAYMEAISIFEKLGDYKDSQEQIALCVEASEEATYQEAMELLENRDFLSAMQMFEKIPHYKASDALIQACENGFAMSKKEEGIAFLENWQYDEAVIAFKEAEAYGIDCSAEISKCEHGILAQNHREPYVTIGKPNGKETNVSYSVQGNISVYNMTRVDLDNGCVRFTLDCTIPKCEWIQFYDTTHGERSGNYQFEYLIYEDVLEEVRKTFVFDVLKEDLALTSMMSIRFGSSITSISGKLDVRNPH